MEMFGHDDQRQGTSVEKEAKYWRQLYKKLAVQYKALRLDKQRLEERYVELLERFVDVNKKYNELTVISQKGPEEKSCDLEGPGKMVARINREAASGREEKREESSGGAYDGNRRDCANESRESYGDFKKETKCWRELYNKLEVQYKALRVDNPRLVERHDDLPEQFLDVKKKYNGLNAISQKGLEKKSGVCERLGNGAYRRLDKPPKLLGRRIEQMLRYHEHGMERDYVEIVRGREFVVQISLCGQVTVWELQPS